MDSTNALLRYEGGYIIAMRSDRKSWVTRKLWKLRSVSTDASRKSHSFSLRSGCRKQSLSLDGSRCRDLMLSLFPYSYFSRMYCNLWYRWVYYNGTDNAEWKPTIKDVQEGAHPKKKEECCWRVWKDQLVLGSSLASNTAKHTWMRPIVPSIHSFIYIPNHLIVPSFAWNPSGSSPFTRAF